MKSKYKLIILLFLIFGILYLVGSTFADYISTARGEKSVQVAGWSIKIGSENISSEGQHDISTQITMVPEASTEINSNLIAPESTLTGDFTIDPTGTDVDVLYTIELGEFEFANSSQKPNMQITALKINDQVVELTGRKYTGKIPVTSMTSKNVKIEAVWVSNENDYLIGNAGGQIKLPINVKVEQNYKKYQKIKDLFDKTGTIAGRPHIGDWVTYDAGTWTQTEIDGIKIGEEAEITANSDYKSATGGDSLPNSDKKFGGFCVNKSRNTGALEYKNDLYMYAKMYDTPDKDDFTEADKKPLSGWRIFDIDETNNKLILISAANPEDYYHAYIADSENAYLAQYLLTGSINGNWAEKSIAETKYRVRNWNMYENSAYSASNARPMTKGVLDSWYGKYIGAGTDTWNADIFRRIYHDRVAQDPYVKYQNLIDNHALYWLCRASGGPSVCSVRPSYRLVRTQRL